MVILEEFLSRTGLFLALALFFFCCFFWAQRGTEGEGKSCRPASAPRTCPCWLNLSINHVAHHLIVSEKLHILLGGARSLLLWLPLPACSATSHFLNRRLAQAFSFFCQGMACGCLFGFDHDSLEWCCRILTAASLACSCTFLSWKICSSRRFVFCLFSPSIPCLMLFRQLEHLLSAFILSLRVQPYAFLVLPSHLWQL